MTEVYGNPTQMLLTIRKDTKKSKEIPASLCSLVLLHSLRSAKLRLCYASLRMTHRVYVLYILTQSINLSSWAKQTIQWIVCVVEPDERRATSKMLGSRMDDRSLRQPITNVTYYKERHGKVLGDPCVATLLGFAPLTPFRKTSTSLRFAQDDRLIDCVKIYNTYTLCVILSVA